MNLFALNVLNAPVRHLVVTPGTTEPWESSWMVGNEDLIDEPTVDQFDTLFRDSYVGLVRTVSFAIGDRELATDAVQEAFARAHVRWAKVQRYDSPAGWVRTVALNIARDQLRRKKRFDRVRHLLANDEATRPDEAATPLTDALVTLSPQQRIAATLFYLDDLSLLDVAATMRLSEGAVKFHLSQARERLRPIVGERVDEQSSSY